MAEAAENIKTTVKEAAERLRNNMGGTEAFINYVPVKTASLFDYLPEGSLIFL